MTSSLRPVGLTNKCLKSASEDISGYLGFMVHGTARLQVSKEMAGRWPSTYSKYQEPKAPNTAKSVKKIVPNPINTVKLPETEVEINDLFRVYYDELRTTGTQIMFHWRMGIILTQTLKRHTHYFGEFQKYVNSNK